MQLKVVNRVFNSTKNDKLIHFIIKVIRLKTKTKTNSSSYKKFHKEIRAYLTHRMLYLKRCFHLSIKTCSSSFEFKICKNSRSIIHTKLISHIQIVLNL